MRVTDHRTLLLCARVVCFTCLPVSQLAAAEHSGTATQQALSLGGYFSSGSYGNSSDTRVRYFPVGYRYGRDNWSLQLSIPYLEVDGSGDLLIDGASVGAGASGSKKGLGDTMVTFKYQLPNVFADGPYLDLVLQTKLPTAHEQRELGTGEVDYSARLDMLQPVGQTTWFGSLGYRVRGKSDRFPGARNGLYGELGFSLPLAESVQGGVLVGYGQRAWEQGDEIGEVTPFLNWQVSSRWTAMSYAVVGVSEGSPDLATGLQLSYRW